MKQIKQIASTLLVAGATVAALNASAVVDTNTFTNVVQSVSINLVLYSNSPVKSDKSITGGKPVTINTKTIVAAFSNAAASIPSLTNFNFGKNPQLVINTTFAATTVTNYATNATGTNIVGVSTNVPSYTIGTNILTVPTNGGATITSATIGTNTNAVFSSISTSNGFLFNGTNAHAELLPTNAITFTNAAGTLTNVAFTGSNHTEVTVYAVTNGSTNVGTNLVLVTFTNVPSVVTTDVTNHQGLEIQGGTPTAPTFASIENYVQTFADDSVTLTATGSGFGTTNGTTNLTETSAEYRKAYVNVYSTTSSSIGNSLSLTLRGFARSMSKYDVLKASKAGTNQVGGITTVSAPVVVTGNIGGTYVTNTSAGPGTNNYTGVYASEYHTNGSTINGLILNPIEVVGQGTISIGAPHAVAQ